MTTTARGFAAPTPTEALAPFTFERRDLLADDVEIAILYCGVCHSDLHTVRDEWGGAIYPCVPGHEIVGRVTRVGESVTRFKEGGLAAVGCMVDSCGHCAECAQGEEQFCLNGMTLTYNSPDQHHAGPTTYGGYSDHIVVKESFLLTVPDALQDQLPGVAPLLCAGITLYSPLRHWRVGPGKKVGIVGLGGLGHMGLKIARALGADEIVLFTTSPGKEADARRLGATDVIVSRDAEQMTKYAGQLDLIIDTVSVPHDLDAYITLLGRDGTLVLVGAPDSPHPSPAVFNLIVRRRSIAGSLIGGIRETQEMLDFCAEHGLTADVEIIPIQQINEAYERMLKSDVKYRFSIDMASLAGAAA